MLKHGQKVRLCRYVNGFHDRGPFIDRIGTVDLRNPVSNPDFPWIQLNEGNGIWWQAEGLIAVDAIESRTYSAWRMMLPKHTQLWPKPEVKWITGSQAYFNEQPMNNIFSNEHLTV